MGLFGQWRALREFSRLPQIGRRIVFYSEGAAYWAHFRPIVRHLTERLDERVTYVTSDRDDPGLVESHANLRTFAIGQGFVRNLWFQLLDATMLVMTMTNLGNSMIRKSRYPVHYSYVFHSIVSTHMIYHRGAFDHYDSILCVGPHHEDEIRATERRHDLPAKALIRHGYGRLDEIIAKRDARETPPGASRDAGAPLILVAPSWGPEGLIESGLAVTLVDALLESGCRVILRPHPETLKRSLRWVDKVVAAYERNPDFSHERDVASKRSLFASNVMVGDWSGAALEYAFGLEKPVLFVDLPRKVNNPEFDAYEMRPVEETLREQLGAVLPVSEIAEAGHVARRLASGWAADSRTIRALRERHVFHVGDSARVAAEWISKRVGELDATGRDATRRV